MKELREVLLRTIYEAGNVLMHYYGNLEHVETKSGEIDLITEADHRSEEIIIEGIRKAFPDHHILAEESGLSVHHVSEFRWVIDPLDGTTNYAHTFPAFCISIGVEHAGRIILGAVYNPYYRELFFAERGGGAFLNEKPIHVSQTRDLSQSLVVTGFAYDRRERADYYLRFFRAFMMRCHGVRRIGSAALDMCFVACGRVEGYWEENLKPWDTAAGWLIVEEAGGRVSDYSGGKFAIEKKQLLATNGIIHDEMREVIALCLK